ncbi:M14 family zinc carboxypeptidase [Brevibacillus nitrificans]|uniref:M14 family zinc carboxypeptidase n=1 Tax=Brevibacillus nitrificans TaxID=651560 RepID=UPI002E1BCE26|nr:M14 family zinc carboxypeptidase [Brevibacillus nitrificans]
MNISKIVENVPNYEVFLTVDELDASTRQLASDFPDIVTLFEAGKSRAGHPILGLKIGEGEKNALCFALPHPNEPIGAMTLEYLSRALAEDEDFRKESGYTWYIIKCIDPDGTKLNEGWFKGPYNIYNYIKNFFRPGSVQQVEWTFPITYKNLHFNTPMPETQAIMKVIDETKPAFLYSLHNAGFGGAYWYITHAYEDIYEDLRASAGKHGVALHLGEPESPSCTKLSEAIYKMMGITEEYDYLEKYSEVAPESLITCGTTSADYALEKNDCVTLLTELPYFFDARIQDMSDSTITRREAIEKNIEMNQKHCKKMDEFLSGIRKYIVPENPFVILVEQMITFTKSAEGAKRKWAEAPEFELPAKVSEVLDNTVIARFYNSLSAGLIARGAEYEMERLKKEGNADEQALADLEDARSRAAAYLAESCEKLEQDLDYTVVPIQKLVQIQIESGLIVAARRLRA